MLFAGPLNPTPKYHHGVLNYTASATNALWAVKMLSKHQATGGEADTATRWWGQPL